MSSLYVREQIMDFLEANAPSETFVDLTVQFAEMKEFLEENSLESEDNWVGVEFIGSDEVPITVPATNDQGLYREDGAVYIHVVAPAAIGVGNGLLTRGESLRNLLRGRRIGEVKIESVTPLNTAEGATLQFDGGFMSASFIVSYERDLNL